MKVRIDPEKKITLYNKEFDIMRNDLDIAIRETIRKMVSKEINAGAIGLKIDIGIVKTTVKDDNAQSGYRQSMLPAISYKVGTVLQQKDETKGKIVKPGEDKEILVDDLGSFFLVSTEEASGQLSMFNTWDEFEDEVTGDDAEDEEENDDE